MEDPLVQTLLNVYEKQTGLQGHEQVIGGGTFGRLLERGLPTVLCSQTQSIPCIKPMNLSPWTISSEQQQSMLRLSMN